MGNVSERSHLISDSRKNSLHNITPYGVLSAWIN